LFPLCCPLFPLCCPFLIFLFAVAVLFIPCARNLHFFCSFLACLCKENTLVPSHRVYDTPGAIYWQLQNWFGGESKYCTTLIQQLVIKKRSLSLAPLPFI
jgi:hypothetical protein